jgi:hypothetical protein
MTSLERELLEALDEVRVWNKQDIAGFEDISPDLRMLRARDRFLRKAIKAASLSTAKGI